MKINQKVFKSITTEPFLVQEISGTELEFHYLNDTNVLMDNVSKGRFYLWASDGNRYKLLVEKGFYEKVKYFFAEDINEIWLTFLQEAGAVRKKTASLTMLISLVPILLVVLGFIFFQDQATYVLIGGLVISLIFNMMYTSKLNKKIRDLNQQAHFDIQEKLTKEVFNQFFIDQKDYMDEYRKANFPDEEDLEEAVVEEIEETELLIEEAEVVAAAVVLDEVIEEVEEAEAIEEIAEEEEVLEEVAEVVLEEKPKAKRVDYNKMTVVQLKDLAREMELKGYSTLNKADIIKLIKKNK